MKYFIIDYTIYLLLVIVGSGFGLMLEDVGMPFECYCAFMVFVFFWARFIGKGIAADLRGDVNAWERGVFE